VVELDYVIQPSCQNCQLTGGSCRSRRHGVNTSAGTSTTALMAGGGKAALAEET
jgi:hypothetical protein